MRILIHSHPVDAHSIAVACALQQRGHAVFRDVGFGVKQGATFSMASTEAGRWRLSHRTDQEERNPADFDVVWFRRPVGIAGTDALHPADRRFVAAEWSEVFKGFAYASSSAFWVNPIGSIARATNKPTQLALASELGFSLPATVITNDVAELGTFMACHAQVIFKPLHGALWQVDGKRLGAYTSVIGPEHLVPAERIQACPGIYQARIPKAYEVRAQFFGRSCFAVKIDSQALVHGEVDWRRERASPDLSASPISLPAKLHALCVALMRRLDLVSGAFDFIVTPDGEWVFLEVNESGQFIFLEMWCEQMPVLDAFVDFLESRSADFEYQPQRERIRLADVFTSAAFQAEVAKDEEIHDIYRHAGVIAES